jgi:hypothetical protein
VRALLARLLNFGVGTRFFGFGFLGSDLALRGGLVLLGGPVRWASPSSCKSPRLKTMPASCLTMPTAPSTTLQDGVDGVAVDG